CAFRASSAAISSLSTPLARSRAFACMVIPVKAAAHTRPSDRTAVATTGRMLRARFARVDRDPVCFFTSASCASGSIKWKGRDVETRGSRGTAPDETEDVDRGQRIGDLAHERRDDDGPRGSEQDRGVVAGGRERARLVGDATAFREITPKHRVVLATLEDGDDRVGRRAVHELSAN